MPHLHRCRSITFNTLYTSSLPSISRDFCGLTLALTSLTLTASVDDEKPSGDWSSHSLPPSHANPFSCPNLCKIDIDGRNFVHACLDLPSWRASLKDTSRDDRIRLSLSKFTPSSGKDREFTMDDVLAFLTELSLYELTLTEIEFYVDMHIAGPAVAAQVPGNMVSLVGLNARFMTLLLNSIEFDDMEYLNVESCDLRVPESDLFGASAPATVLYNLILQDIDAGGDIAGFLRSFPGYALDVVRCPGFDDRALSVLASPEWEGPITLSFCDCDGFSVRGIIRMLEALAAANTDGYGRRVNSLTVEGRGPPAPTEEERKKIEQRGRRVARETRGSLLSCGCSFPRRSGGYLASRIVDYRTNTYPCGPRRELYTHGSDVPIIITGECFPGLMVTMVKNELRSWLPLHLSLASRLLGYLLLHAPADLGHWHLSSQIVSCVDDEALLVLGNYYNDHLIRPFNVWNILRHPALARLQTRTILKATVVPSTWLSSEIASAVYLLKTLTILQ
ncbi:hypothetical protein LshimejAT787_1200210 [Lyophyllum shimeji]|uniref:Uncharacterized protein n=1 Tax=Lyophyllum shimeji TaxID=47721 RepID=A0A9P3PWJ1_LYOSH|nr:hypothetical protein LshimejAT787_1200210 [Lyophyllum shimeji]